MRHFVARWHLEGKPIPTELRKDEQQLRKEIELEDDNTAVPRNHVDDEYAHAGEADPKVLLTTSRDPSSRLIQFAKVRRVAGYIKAGQHSTAQQCEVLHRSAWGSQ
jgi:hypothetical protein